jgi:DNA-binding FrmR family transcriptional regulator
MERSSFTNLPTNTKTSLRLRVAQRLSTKHRFGPVAINCLGPFQSGTLSPLGDIASMKHESHPDIIKRLKRAGGHLTSVITMIENGRPCVELAQQLHAVESAVTNAKRALIHDHIDHCLGDVAGHDATSSSAPLKEFRQLAKYL